MKIIYFLLHFSGIPFFIREIIQKRKVTIILYHDISPKNALNHFSFLKNKYNIISFQDFIIAKRRNDLSSLPPKSIIITLDDGHRGNYNLLPIIKKLNIPITIFLCSDIVDTDKQYWFKQDLDEITKEKLKKLTNIKRIEYLETHQKTNKCSLYQRFALSKSEIIEMSKNIDFQSHSMNHPCLPYCTDEESRTEIRNSKIQLEQKFGLKIRIFSYPNGDYSEREINYLKENGYEAGVTCDLWFNDINTDLFQLKRLDIRDEADIYELSVKVTGIFIYIKRKIKGKNFGFVRRNRFY